MRIAVAVAVRLVKCGKSLLMVVFMLSIHFTVCAQCSLITIASFFSFFFFRLLLLALLLLWFNIKHNLCKNARQSQCERSVSL